jgi:hypothetical protein
MLIKNFENIYVDTLGALNYGGGCFWFIGMLQLVLTLALIPF